MTRSASVGRGALTVALAGLTLGMGGCVSFMEAASPLSPEAKRVLLVPAGQDWSVELAEGCNRRGSLEQVWSEHFARARAAELRASVAQILAAQSYNGSTHSLDVRFWDCAPAARQRLIARLED